MVHTDTHRSNPQKIFFVYVGRSQSGSEVKEKADQRSKLGSYFLTSSRRRCLSLRALDSADWA